MELVGLRHDKTKYSHKFLPDLWMKFDVKLKRSSFKHILYSKSLVDLQIESTTLQTEWCTQFTTIKDKITVKAFLNILKN